MSFPSAEESAVLIFAAPKTGLTNAAGVPLPPAFSANLWKQRTTTLLNLSRSCETYESKKVAQILSKNKGAKALSDRFPLCQRSAR
jgi:hypothetical protein